MTKVLRKYNKWLLAIFGSLLLVTWLVSGTAGQFQADPGKRVMATVGPKGEKILASDSDKAEREYKALTEMARGSVKAPPPAGLGIENGTHWLLLSREAEAAGLVGEAGDGVDFLGDLAKVETQLRMFSDPQLRQFAQQNPQFVAQQAASMAEALKKNKDSFAGQAGLRPREFEVALAKLRGVYRLIQAYGHGARMSDVQLTREARELVTQVSMDCVIVPADNVVASIPEPTAEQLNSLFEKYKGVRPGEGEYGFGYMRPKRVKLEWMTISKAAVSDAVKLDAVEVNKYWQQNKADFKGEFAAVRADVEKKLKEARVADVLAEADRAYKARIKSATRKLPLDGGVRKLPADWESQRPKMETLAQELVAAVEQATKVKMPLPTVEVRASEYIPLNDMKTAGQLAFMQYDLGGKRGPFSALLELTREINPAGDVGLQVGVPFDFAITDFGLNDRVYFTVLDAKGESPAENLDEVRAAVVKDAKKLAAFEKLKSDAGTVQLLAVTDGLEAVTKMFATPVAAGLPADAKPEPLPLHKRVIISKTRSPEQFPELDDQSLRDAVMSQVHALGADTKISTENAAIRTLAVPLPKTQSLAVMQITGHRPLSIETFRTIGDYEVSYLLDKELQTGGKEGATAKQVNPFSFAAVKQRAGYKATRGEGKSSEEEPTDAPAEEKKPA